MTSYEDLRALPPHVIAELVGGEPYVSARPPPNSLLALFALRTELGPPLRLDGETYRIVLVASGESSVRAEPFDAIDLELRNLWAR